MTIWAALVLVTLCAILWDFGIVLQKLAVDKLPRIGLGRGLPAALASLLGSRRWMAGLAASAIGWGLFAYALSFTPVSVARAIQGSGFVILAIFSLLFLRHRLSAREWIGVALIACGILALGISESPSTATRAEISIAPLSIAVVACALVCLAALLLPAALKVPLPPAVANSIVAGTLLGMGDVATKILIELMQAGGLSYAAGGAALSLILTYVSGFLTLSRAYQAGRAILVTAVSDLCSRLVAILLGIGALGEALPSGLGPRALAVSGYAAILTGAAFLARFSGERIAEGLTAPSPGGKS